MNIAFTICSNNYLAHANTLAFSFKKHHPDFEFIVGLVDQPNNSIDYSQFKFKIINIEDIGIEDLQSLVNKYNIVELNTAVKPTYFKFLFEKYLATSIIYIDPDILVLSRFNEVIKLLPTKNIIITPHILSPIDDEFAPTDYHTLRGGVFNLGFIALSSYELVKDFLNWWNDRVIKYGYSNFSKNMFYDQIWINYVPSFYENYSILKHPGYNMANWNLHERSLSIRDDEIMVNEIFPLRFFHFSSYNYQKPTVICSYQNRYNFENRLDLIELFDTYRNLLLANNVEKIRSTEVYYYHIIQQPKKSRLLKLISSSYNRFKRASKILANGHE